MYSWNIQHITTIVLLLPHSSEKVSFLSKTGPSGQRLLSLAGPNYLRLPRINRQTARAKEYFNPVQLVWSERICFHIYLPLSTWAFGDGGVYDVDAE